jgi:hypothetical protein
MTEKKGKGKVLGLKDLEKRQALTNLSATIAGSLFSILLNISEQRKFFTVIENPRKKIEDKVDPNEVMNDPLIGKFIFINKRNNKIYHANMQMMPLKIKGSEDLYLPLFKIAVQLQDTSEDCEYYGIAKYVKATIAFLEEDPSLVKKASTTSKLDQLLEIEWVSAVINKETQKMLFDLTGHKISLELVEENGKG